MIDYDRIASILGATRKGKIKMVFDAGDIIVLSLPEAVRKRPKMYIGEIDSKTLHTTVVDSLYKSFPEIDQGNTEVTVRLNLDGSLTLRGNGQGADQRRLRAFFEETPAGSVVGMLAPINILSSYMHVRSQNYGLYYEKGKLETIIDRAGMPILATDITFLPDPEIFGTLKFEADLLKKVSGLKYIE